MNVPYLNRVDLVAVSFWRKTGFKSAHLDNAWKVKVRLCLSLKAELDWETMKRAELSQLFFIIKGHKR